MLHLEGAEGNEFGFGEDQFPLPNLRVCSVLAEATFDATRVNG